MGPDVLTGFKADAVANAAAPELHRLKTATDGFEAIFTKNLLSAMHKGIEEVHFGDSMGSDTYQDMFDDQVSQSLAQKGALGIGKMMFTPMAKQVLARAAAKLQIGTTPSTVSATNAGSQPSTSPSTNEGAEQ